MAEAKDGDVMAALRTYYAFKTDRLLSNNTTVELLAQALEDGAAILRCPRQAPNQFGTKKLAKISDALRLFLVSLGADAESETAPHSGRAGDPLDLYKFPPLPPSLADRKPRY
jgi:hypothetical protein